MLFNGQPVKMFQMGQRPQNLQNPIDSPPDEKPKNGAAPRSHFIFSLHWKTDLPFVSQEIIIFFFTSRSF